jgi:hypothetical protein
MVHTWGFTNIWKLMENVPIVDQFTGLMPVFFTSCHRFLLYMHLFNFVTTLFCFRIKTRYFFCCYLRFINYQLIVIMYAAKFNALKWSGQGSISNARQKHVFVNLYMCSLFVVNTCVHYLWLIHVFTFCG